MARPGFPKLRDECLNRELFGNLRRTFKIFESHFRIWGDVYCLAQRPSEEDCEDRIIEHIGCQDGSQKVTPATESDRRRTIERIRGVLRPGGILVIGTPNRLFPLDQYHGAHSYLPGRLPKWAIKRRVGLHLPFSKRNFLVSKVQLARVLYGFQELRWLSAACGISFGRSDFNEYLPEGHLGPVVTGYVHLIDRLRLSTSPLSPVLHVVARK